MSISFADVSIGIVSVMLAALAFLSAGRAASTAKRTEELRQSGQQRAVDADAYHRAQGIYDAALEQLRRQNTDLETRLRQVSHRLIVLERVLREAGVPVPIDDMEIR